ncbi:MAG: glycosyltransferase family 4 protein [Planctomycetota bacterium]
MKVLLVHDFGTLNGGAEHMTVTLRGGLRDRGHEVEFFSSRAKPLPLPIVSDHTCFGTTSQFNRVTRAFNPLAAIALKKVIKRFKPDIVHCRMFMNQLSPLILPVIRGIPSLLHVVNYNLICPLNTKVLPDGSPCHDPQGPACRSNGCLPILGRMRAETQKRMWDRWEGAFNLIITNSNWVRDRLMNEGQRVDGVVWNGVPVTAPRPPLSDPPTVSYAGRLIPKKGVDVLIQAMARVAAELPDARLLIAGDGPLMQEHQALAARLKINQNTTFLGHLSRPDMERALEAAWVQAVPSVWEEPFGLVGAEALMRGTAAVVTECGGLAEQIVPDANGYHVPAGDAGALAKALLKVLRDRDKAERFGKHGRAHAIAQFTEEVVIDHFLKLYEQMLTASPADTVVS